MENLTIVIPFWDGHKTINRLLDSIPNGIPVIVINDYGSKLPFTNRKNTRILSLQESGYFSGACNAGFKACNTDVLVLNQDVWFADTHKYGKHHSFKIIDEIRAGVHDLGTYGHGVMAHPAWPGGYVQGTFMFMTRPALRAVGGFNEVDYPLWGATAEWQLRACRKGFRAIPVEDIPGLKHEQRHGSRYGTSITTALKEEPQKQRLFIRTPPAISVIVPLFNYGHYLQDAVDSLMAQTFQSFEVIIVDDASRDNSAELAESLSAPFKGIHTIRHIKNQGTAAALNTGVKTAFGKFITVLSADDKYAPKRLETLYRVIEQNPSSVVYDHCLEFGEKSRHRIIPTYDFAKYDFEALLNQNYIHAGMMYSKRAWEVVGGYPEEMEYGREDWAFAVGLGAKGYCGIQIREPLYLYRDEGQGRHHRNTDSLWRDRFQQQMIELYPLLYAGERPMGCCGKGRRKAAVTSQPTPSGAVALSESDIMAAQGGKVGDVRLMYTGVNIGTMNIYGPSRRRYKYGRSPRRIFVWVAEVDLQWMLDTGLFKVAPLTRQARVPLTKKEVEEVNPTTTQPEPEPAPVEAVEEQMPGVPDEPEYAPMTIKALKVLEDGGADWPSLLALEQEGKLSTTGKPRKGAVDFILKMMEG